MTRGGTFKQIVNNGSSGITRTHPEEKRVWSPAFVGYLEMSEEDIGVRGAEFFVISKKLIGTVSSEEPF